MKEYERSIKAKSIQPYINYCVENGFTFVSKTQQNRIVYQNHSSPNKLARLTTDIIDGKSTTVLDFKDVGNIDKSLKISSESLPLVLDDGNKDIILSFLSVLDFYISADNLRTRYVYKKDDVEFEIDQYTRPQMNVIGIEGDETQVEKIYAEIKQKIIEN